MNKLFSLDSPVMRFLSRMADVMILNILSRTGRQGGIKQTPSIPAGGGKKQHRQPRLPDGAEIDFQEHIRRENLFAPENIVGFLPELSAFGVFQPETAVRKAAQRFAFQGKIRERIGTGKGIAVDQAAPELRETGHAAPPRMIFSVGNGIGSIP